MNNRQYRMSARSDAVQATGARILDAALRLYAAYPVDQIRLEAIAADADVSVPTIVRRYGGKAGVIVALVTRELSQLAERRTAHADDPIDSIIEDLVEHYEVSGTLILKVYSESPLVEGLAEIAAEGRRYHVEWCRQTFADRISGPPVVHARRLAAAIAICDATTWRILRQDGGLDPHETVAALRELFEQITG